jgi:hypothetical protein
MKSIKAYVLLLLLVALMPLLAINPAAATQQDFKLTVSPNSVTLKAGSSLHLYPSSGQGLFVTSLNGLTGTINVGEKGPFVKNAPIVVPTRYDIWVSSTSPTSSTVLTVSTTTSTPKGTYTLTITGTDITGGSNSRLTHTVTLTVTVT